MKVWLLMTAFPYSHKLPVGFFGGGELLNEGKNLNGVDGTGQQFGYNSVIAVLIQV